MSKFTIRLSNKVGRTRMRLYKLFAPNIQPIDEFEELIIREGTFSHELDKIYAILEHVCNLSMLPKNMYRMLQLGNLPFRVYEAKSQNLRYYVIKIEGTGKIIILGGRKSTQKKDLKQIARLVKDICKEGFAVTNAK